jgi:hypothetical protein
VKRSFLTVAIVLAGCASPEQRAAFQQQQAYQQQQQEAAYMASLKARCSQFGFSEGSTQHSECMMSLHQQNQANAGAAAAAIIRSQPQPTRPRCSSLPPFIAGYEAAAGRCY